MKNLILFLILLSSFNLFSQENKELEEMNEALKLLNDIRSLNILKPLKLNPRLNELAEQRAIKLAENGGVYKQSTDHTGESYFWGKNPKRDYNYYNVILGLSLNIPGAKDHTIKQMNCKTCTSVGFGKAKSGIKHYSFVVYDSLR